MLHARRSAVANRLLHTALGAFLAAFPLCPVERTGTLVIPTTANALVTYTGSRQSFHLITGLIVLLGPGRTRLEGPSAWRSKAP
jgi:hypothetical protein